MKETYEGLSRQHFWWAMLYTLNTCWEAMGTTTDDKAITALLCLITIYLLSVSRENPYTSSGLSL